VGKFTSRRPYWCGEVWGIAVLTFLVPICSIFGQVVDEQKVSHSTFPIKTPRLYDEHVDRKVSLSLVAVGDVMMGGSALPVIRKKGIDYPFHLTRAILRTADISFANLEAPFTLSGRPFDKTFTFRVPPEYAEGLDRAGFDVLTLANNHTLDYGPEGLCSTLEVLDRLGIAFCGVGRNVEEAERGVILERGGWRIGFLAFSLTYPSAFWATLQKCGTAYPHLDRLKKTLRRMREEVDVVVVSFHWGGELKTYPKSYQRYYAHRAVEWGADLVVGHHPHVIQGLEIYRDRLIAYSLGNFVFGSYSLNARESIILRTRFDRKGFLLAEVIPISVFNLDVHFQPRVLEGSSRKRVVHTLNDISRNLNGGNEIVSESGLIVSD